MSKTLLEPGCRVSPAPAVILSCKNGDKTNLITVAWTGNICSEPAMAYVSIRPGRYSYKLVKESGEFVLNLCDASMVKAVDICGAYTGSRTDKWKKAGLTPEQASKVDAPLIKESPVSIECKVKEIIPLGSHDLFIGEVVAVDAAESLIDEYGRFRPENAGILSYTGNGYMAAGEKLAEKGFSVRRKSSGDRRKTGNFSKRKTPSGEMNSPVRDGGMGD